MEFHDLPMELVYQIIEFFDLYSLHKFSQTCKKFRTTRSRADMDEIKTPDDVIVSSNQVIKFNQQGPDLLVHREDSIEEPNLENPFGKRVGIRFQGDRCIISKYPLKLQSMKWKSFTCDQVIYFEVTVLSDSETMRIGLVHQDWDLSRPPGSSEKSIGYCSDDGHLSIGNKYDDRYMFSGSWMKGDTVGCGYTPFQENGLVFFTMNGRWLGDAPYSVATNSVINYQHSWHAAFSSASPVQVKFNLGSDEFQYPLRDDHRAPYLMQRNTTPDLTMTLCFELNNEAELSNLAKIKNNHIHFSSCIYNQSVQSNIPITACQTRIEYENRGYYYYEIQLLNQPVSRPCPFLSFGLATKPFPQMNHVGWCKDSIGYHRYIYLTSDDGKIFHGSFASSQCTSPFGKGDTLGCGYCPNQKKVSFFKNGVKISENYVEVKYDLYITISATGEWHLKVNTGAPQIIQLINH